MKKIALYSTLFALIDIFSKYLVLSFLTQEKVILKNAFKLIYAENTGIAFSINIPSKLIFFLNILVLSFFIYFIKTDLRTDKPLAQISASLIIGGGLANLIDRAWNGFVIDFISIYSYPIFNLADVFISLGLLFFILFYAKIIRNQKLKNDTNTN